MVAVVELVMVVVPLCERMSSRRALLVVDGNESADHTPSTASVANHRDSSVAEGDSDSSERKRGAGREG